MHRPDNKGSAAIKQTNDGQVKEKRYLSSSDYRSQSMRAFAVYGFVRALLWLGFVLAISFMEAPLKFRAPGVS